MREEARGELGGSRLRRGEVLETTDAYTRSVVTYRSRGLTVSGCCSARAARGPSPGSSSTTATSSPAPTPPGQGMAREQDHLARAGYVVLHTDYRGHAGSDPASDLDLESRLGYARDAVTAVRSWPASPTSTTSVSAWSAGRWAAGDAERAGDRPGPGRRRRGPRQLSSDYVDNLRQFTEPGRPDEAAELYAELGGPPETNPEPYRQLSPRTYLDRITEPVLALHGELDETCPPPWADATQRALTGAGSTRGSRPTPRTRATPSTRAGAR